ncbi:MAG: hypothetical protein F4X97_06740 [Boseongicola sp. SB0662_bin_57]|nr:hypothetical protein [Boseongicola sp. SB0662_bin_57]
MPVTRLHMRSLIVAVAALSVTAVLAGPAHARSEEPAAIDRTGTIHLGCDQFSLENAGDDDLELRAWCRSGGDNSCTEQTHIDLGAAIGNREGRPVRAGYSFQDNCAGGFVLLQHAVGARLTADCPRRTIYAGTSREAVEWVTSSLQLAQYCRVNAEGEFEVKQTTGVQMK